MSQPFDFFAPSFVADPYPAYAELREQQPLVFHLPTSHWLLSRYDDVQQSLRNPHFRSGRVDVLLGRVPASERAGLSPLKQLLDPRLLFTDGAQHQRLRSLLALAFTPRQIERMRPAVRATVDDLLAGLGGAEAFDAIAQFADPLPSRAITRLLGLPADSYPQFKQWTGAIYDFVGISPVDPATRARTAASAASELVRFLEGQIAARTSDPEGDLLASLLAAEEQGERLTRTEIIANVIGLLNAGHETTTNLIGNALAVVLQQPALQKQLAQEPALLAGVLEEVVRLESPVQIIARKLDAAVELHGVTLSAGADVLLLLGAANRDPRAFDEPDQFHSQRAGSRHLAYGLGPHYCLGAALARLIGEEALAALLARFPNLRLAGPLRWRSNPIFRGLHALPLHTGTSPTRAIASAL